MEKQVVRKEDGRYLIFYAFERPVPKIDPERAVPVGKVAPPPADSPEKEGDA